MKSIRSITVAALFAVALAPATISGAQAAETYSSSLTSKFMDWCTGTGSNSETACTCTLKQLAVSVPLAALTAFLADKSGGGSGFSLSTASVATAATVTQALTACVK